MKMDVIRHTGVPSKSLIHNRPSVGDGCQAWVSVVGGSCARRKTQKPLRLHWIERWAWHIFRDQYSSCDSSTGVCSLVVSCSVSLSSSGLRHIFHGAFKMLKIKPQVKFHVAVSEQDNGVCLLCSAWR